jgi:hypothetical protein
VMNEWTRDSEETPATFAAEIRRNMLTYAVWSGNYAMIIPNNCGNFWWQQAGPNATFVSISTGLQPGQAPRERWGEYA